MCLNHTALLQVAPRVACCALSTATKAFGLSPTPPGALRWLNSTLLLCWYNVQRCLLLPTHCYYNVSQPGTVARSIEAEDIAAGTVHVFMVTIAPVSLGSRPLGTAAQEAQGLVSFFRTLEKTRISRGAWVRPCVASAMCLQPA